MTPPKFDLEKIKYATDATTFEKAVDLYESGKVTQFKEGIGAYAALVIGTKPYRVSIEARRYGYGYCECYLGKNDTLCKHLVALSLYAVKEGRPLSGEDKRQTVQVSFSGTLGTLKKTELSAIKKSISGAMRYIKSYEGPSRIWFSYQNSLSEGCNRLAKIISDLPVSEQTAGLLVDMLLRLDDRLCRGGVDDSDGTVGGFIGEVVVMLEEYAKMDQSCIKAFKKLCDRETCFGWEESLVRIVDEGLVEKY
ncbi:MAG: hypothetical protein Q8P11_02555 [bacterium]|nr:hypothetical protein [bacterium]